MGLGEGVGGGDVPNKGDGAAAGHEGDFVDHLDSVSTPFATGRWGEGTYSRHGLDAARRMLPVDPDGVEAERREEARHRDRAQAKVADHHGRDLAVGRVAEGLSGAVGLEERGRGVGGHAIGVGERVRFLGLGAVGAVAVLVGGGGRFGVGAHGDGLLGLLGLSLGVGCRSGRSGCRCV